MPVGFNNKTMYIDKTVTKPNKVSPGSATAKDPNVTIIFTEDLVSEPVRNSGGVKLEGNFVFKPGKKPIQVYMTASKQEPSYESDGEEDNISVSQKFTGMHPGDELEINELIQNTLGRNCILIYGSCQQSFKKVYGTKCAPMQLKPGFAANNDSTNHTLAFEQYQKTKWLPAHYEGELPTGDPYAVGGLAIDAASEHGYQYKLAASETVSSTVDVNTVDLPAGTFLTVIGSGGSEPAVLSGGALTGATVILKDGADWTALDGASIDLEVYKAGSTTYLIERKRS